MLKQMQYNNQLIIVTLNLLKKEGLDIKKREFGQSWKIKEKGIEHYACDERQNDIIIIRIGIKYYIRSIETL